MDFLSPLGSYGLRRFLDVVANILLKFGLRYMDRLMDGGSTSVPGVGDHGSGVGSGGQVSGWMGGDTTFVPMGDGAGSEVGSGAVAEEQLPGCGHCVVEFLDASEVSLVVP